MDLNDVSGDVVDAAIKVHKVLGPGLLESAYKACMAYELRKRGRKVATEVGLPLKYEEVELEVGYRLDLLVEDAVIVELKAAASILPLHKAQLLSYLKLSNQRVGLLINFHEKRLVDGICRMINDP
jgi:GxxExxY protein